MIDHDTVESDKQFIDKVNETLQTKFFEKQINTECEWYVDNLVLGKIELKLHIRCLPKEETGAIEDIMLDALTTDEVEKDILSKSKTFILDVSQSQSRYLQKKSRIAKAVFNSYFAIRTPEEKYDERARVLKAYDWEKNEVLNNSFKFLDFTINE